MMGAHGAFAGGDPQSERELRWGERAGLFRALAELQGSRQRPSQPFPGQAYRAQKPCANRSGVCLPFPFRCSVRVGGDWARDFGVRV
jgi:hypothetical protein